MKTQNVEHVHGIDPGLVQSAHTRIMVQAGIYAVYSDSIHAKLLEVGNITRAACSVGERVDEGTWFLEGIVGVAWIYLACRAKR